MAQEKKIIEFNQNAFHLAAKITDDGDGACAKIKNNLGGPRASQVAKSGDSPSAEQMVLTEIKRVIAEIIKGNFGARAILGGTEREEESLKSFNTMLETVLQPFKLSNDYFDKIANGNEMKKIDEYYPGDLGLLKEKINHCTDVLAYMTQEAGSLTADISDGVLHARAKVDGLSGRWAEILEKVNAAVETLVKPLQEIEKVMEHLANNDFSIRVSGEYQGECGQIKNRINAGVDNMAKLMIKLRENADQLSALGEQMSKIIEQSELAHPASEAKPQIEKVKHVPDGQVILDMNLYFEEIERVLTIIDDIAAQISLLALNAAIESAAARENGSGLAAIAEDIRKLAERTTEADRRLSELIQNAHNGIQQAIIILSERSQTLPEQQEG